MIIESLLDTDLYKLTMQQVVLHHFPGAQVEYRFHCRSDGIDLRPFVRQIREEIAALCSLRMRDDELEYLRGLRYLKSDYVDFLGLFQLNPRNILVTEAGDLPGGVAITIQGPWLHTILFEVPVLAIVSEVYFRNQPGQPDYVEGERRLRDKVEQVHALKDTDGFKFAEFGTRRRYSCRWHGRVLECLKQWMPANLAGTSNLMYAMRLGLTPMGTMAHEYLQACQALGPRLRDSQVFAFDTWAKEYRGDLGIALSDTYGMDAFLRDFDLFFCKLFDGARHDSGDPFDWGEKLIAHYESMRIDPRSKTMAFSDALTIPLAIELYYRFRGRVRLGFGVGTNLTNDIGHEALQIVIKMVQCNGQPVAKVSDTPGKTICLDPGYLAYLKQVYAIVDVPVQVENGDSQGP